jgi:hypothetical protein
LFGLNNSQTGSYVRWFSSLEEFDTKLLTKVYLSSLSDIERDQLIIRNKSVFIFNSFILDHPDSLVENWDQLVYLLQEKSSLKSWYDSVLSKWSLLNDIPSWLINDEDLRNEWLAKYQSELVSLRLAQNKCLEANLKAKALYDTTIQRNQEELDLIENEVYQANPVILIHRITPAALSEADLLKLQTLNKEERRLKRKELVDVFKLNLMRQYTNQEITLEQLIKITK